MAHNDLVHEVARQLMTRFTPPPVAIKKRIESLIDVSDAWARFPPPSSLSQGTAY
jgi:hypothetical protein